MRTLTWKRNLGYAILRPIIQGVLTAYWWTCRVETILGDEHTQELINTGEPILPCYWHQMHLFGAWYMRVLQKRGLDVGFLISPSVDGEVPARIVQSWGAVAIRGSSNRTGAMALKNMYTTIRKDRVSPVTTPDGPKGPIRTFKPGTILLAQLTQSPMLPVAYTASRYWQLKTWDEFIIPKPFSRIVIAVGRPQSVPKKSTPEQLEQARVQMEEAMSELVPLAKAAI